MPQIPPSSALPIGYIRASEISASAGIKQTLKTGLHTGGAVTGKLMWPHQIGSLYCPIIKPDTSGLEEELLKAMSEPIADESQASNLGCAFVVRMPDEIELEQLRSEISREITSGVVYYPTAHDDTLEDRINAELDRKQAARDNIND